MIRRSLFLSITAAGLLLAAPAFASVYEDDAQQAISLAVRSLRVPNEATESTDQYFKTLPLYNIKSLSYPVTWGFTTNESTKEPTLLFSKKLSKLVSEKLVYKTPNFPNGMINVGAPLAPYHSRTYYPLLSDGNKTTGLKTVSVKPIIPSMLAEDPLHNSYVNFCSFRAVKQTGKNSETVIFSTLNDFDAKLKTITTPSTIRDFDGEAFITNVYSSATADATFMGLPAKKYTLTFDSRINKVAVRLKYEGLYTLKNGYVLCAEVVAPEKGFDAFRKNFDAMLTTIVPSYEFGGTGTNSTSSSSASSTSSKASDRACKRTKRC